VTLVAVSKILDAIWFAPWWSIHDFFNPFPDIIIVTIFRFVYWVAAQWSTWIIAF